MPLAARLGRAGATRRGALAALAAIVATPFGRAFAARREVGHGHHPPHHAAPPEPLVPETPAQTPIGPVATTAQWAYAEDYTTHAMLLTKDGDTQMPPSSMTKLMTLYITYERLASGKLKLSDTLPVSERAWKTGGSKMFVEVNTQVSVRDLISGIIVDSGNDAAIVLAEGIDGSEAQFVVEMNATAKRLGLTGSHFANCTGLPAPDHYMTCHDIARLAWHIIHDFPQYYKFDRQKTFRYSNIEQANRNPLVQNDMADGLKTGHTNAGGYGLVASAERNGRRVILVLNGMPAEIDRKQDGARLLDWAFNNFENVTLFTAGDVIERAPVWLGTSKDVPLVGGRDLIMTLPRGWRQSVKVTVQYDSPVRAPISRGDTLGSLVITGAGSQPMTLPLLAGADVPRLGLPGRAMAVLSHYVTGH
ncbi:MAG: D-alanyl-D-alanine carboxypeptidase [Rhodospirillales bacterium]|nr:D-alanyl-D-alanine carboxypeptidase [Rhodospirillales bacterium]